MTESTSAHHPDHVVLRRVRRHLVLMGGLSVVAGLFAISAAFVATMASVFVLGIVLIVAGAFEVVHAVFVRDTKSFALHLLAAALYLVVGVFVIEDPLQTAAILTLVLAACFFVGGGLRVLTAVVMRFPSWQWVALNGAVDFLLGVLILNRWPDSGEWVIGMFIGIDLLLHGWSWLILGLSLPAEDAAQPT